MTERVVGGPQGGAPGGLSPSHNRDQPTQRDRIRAVIRDFYGAGEGQFLPLAADLADRIDEALSAAQPALVGPFLSPEELAEIRLRYAGTPSGAVKRLLAHVEAANATIRNQNAAMADQQRQVRELEALQSELPRALYLTRLDEVMGRGVMATGVPLIAEVLRAAQAEREGRRD